MTVLMTVLTVLLVITAFSLIGIILIQRGKGGGLVAFGGGGVEQAFGTHAANMAQKITAVLAVLFLALAILLGKLHRPGGVTKDGMIDTGKPAQTSGDTAGTPAENAEAGAPAEKETTE